MKKLALIILTVICCQVYSQTTPLTYKNGKLVYEADSLGNRIPDFSYAGYMSGEKPIPKLTPTLLVEAINDDATQLIQSAIEQIEKAPLAPNGFRGVILLSAGEYRISGQLIIRKSGVVIKGSGIKNTKLIATGKDRRTLIRITGINDISLKDTLTITNKYVPVNSKTVTIATRRNLKVGDKIYIHRPSTKEWIDKLEMEHHGGGITALGWKPGNQDIYWDRTITAIKGNTITFDTPITTALDNKYGGGNILPYTWNGRINNIGIEDLSLVSEYDKSNPKDESHAWTAITMDNAQDVWVRNINFHHFAGSAVYINKTVKRVTVENCKSLEPISEIGGQRRYAFFTAGQQCLFLRIYSEYAYHDFGVGYTTSGPNAFVQCHAYLPYSFSGAIERWSSGTLFDIVNSEGQALSFKNRIHENQGTGWAGANSVFWQCSASLIECFAPPTAQNWSFGSWAEFSGNGYWAESNNHVNPRSLYYTQLQERLPDNNTETNLVPFGGDGTSSPSIEQAMTMTRQARTPAITLSEWIDKLTSSSTSKYDTKEIKVFKLQNKKNNDKTLHKAEALSIENGWITRNGIVQTGSKHDIQWWNGSTQPQFLQRSARPHLTRYTPSRTGTGFTDDVDSVANWMQNSNIVALDHNYGLWYDRRRDDHERVRRINGEVWAPFYEQPFARSGEGIAYDGLSKYDLTKYNDWYWMRLRQFADKADQKGLVLLHQNYFQHNIIEAGAHWADSPWRPENNINGTGFPEPVPYAGDKRIFFAEQFYDVTHPVHRELHRKYIRKCLDNFRGNNSVIQFISAEYTGPLHFVEFWLDVIAEWKQETGENVLIALSATKDVQDAILADPVRSKVVDIIDIRYWQHREDGTTYAPQGGQNLAPRQHARLVKPGKVSFASVYRAVSEYRNTYPDKAVIYYSASYPEMAWASFMAQGSLACLPKIQNPKFLKDAMVMKIDRKETNNNKYVLSNTDKGCIIYSEKEEIELDLTQYKGKYLVYQINPKTGDIFNTKRIVKAGSAVTIQTNNNIIWLEKQ